MLPRNGPEQEPVRNNGRADNRRHPDNDRLFIRRRAWFYAKQAFGAGNPRTIEPAGRMMLDLEAYCVARTCCVRLAFAAALHAFLALEPEDKARAFLAYLDDEGAKAGKPRPTRTDADVKAWATAFPDTPAPAPAIPDLPKWFTHEQIPLAEVWTFEDDYRAAMRRVMGAGREASLGMLWWPGWTDDGLACPFCDATFDDEGERSDDKLRRHLIEAHGLPADEKGGA